MTCRILKTILLLRSTPQSTTKCGGEGGKRLLESGMEPTTQENIHGTVLSGLLLHDRG